MSDNERHAWIEVRKLTTGIICYDIKLPSGTTQTTFSLEHAAKLAASALQEKIP